MKQETISKRIDNAIKRYIPNESDKVKAYIKDLILITFRGLQEEAEIDERTGKPYSDKKHWFCYLNNARWFRYTYDFRRSKKGNDTMNKKYLIGKNHARFFATEWQNDFDKHNYFMSELAYYSDYFERLGKRYGLLKEFRENGII